MFATNFAGPGHNHTGTDERPPRRDHLSSSDPPGPPSRPADLSSAQHANLSSVPARWPFIDPGALAFH